MNVDIAACLSTSPSARMAKYSPTIASPMHQQAISAVLRTLSEIILSLQPQSGNRPVNTGGNQAPATGINAARKLLPGATIFYDLQQQMIRDPHRGPGVTNSQKKRTSTRTS